MIDVTNMTSIEAAIYAAAVTARKNPHKAVLAHRHDMAIAAWRRGEGEYPLTAAAKNFNRFLSGKDAEAPKLALVPVEAAA